MKITTFCGEITVVFYTPSGLTESSDANEEIMNAADESNSGDEDDDSDSTMTEEVPITVPQKQGKASKNTTTPKHLICACPCCMRPLTNS